MKNPYKILISISIILIAVLIYFYAKSPFVVENGRVSNLKYKVIPLEDSMLVFIPYKIVVANNRLQQIKLKSIYDDYITKGKIQATNLIYNRYEIEITNYSGRSNKRYESEYDYIKMKYRKTIFPFTTRTFYFYKSHMLSNPSDIKTIDYSEVEEQLSNLNVTINFKIDEKTIDSLYKIDDQKRFNVSLMDDSKRFMPKYIKAKINSKSQIPVNTIDSIKKMNKEDAKKYLLKLATTDTRELLKDF